MDMNDDEIRQAGREAAEAYWKTLNEQQQKDFWRFANNEAWSQQELIDPKTGEWVRNEQLQVTQFAMLFHPFCAWGLADIQVPC